MSAVGVTRDRDEEDKLFKFNYEWFLLIIYEPNNKRIDFNTKLNMTFFSSSTTGE